MESGAFDHQRASPTELYEPRQTRPNRLSANSKQAEFDGVAETRVLVKLDHYAIVEGTNLVCAPPSRSEGI